MLRPGLEELGALVEQVLEHTHVTDPRRGGERVTWSTVNLYHINSRFVMPLTHAHQCSFVELVADGPQEPQWFLSHWWGTPFRDTLSMLRFHAKERGLGPATAYWMCTFANNQHCLAGLTCEDLSQTPFVRAIMADGCLGTLMLMNETAEPFKRTWCTLENFISTTQARADKRVPHLLDVAAVIPEGQQRTNLREIPRSAALLKDDGDGCLLESVEAARAQFPKVVSLTGVRVDVAAAQASNEDDKRNILRFIVGGGRRGPSHQGGDGEVGPGGEPPERHECYDQVNRAIHLIFAPRALYYAAQQDGIEEIGRLLDRGLASVNWQSPSGTTPLYMAAAADRVAAVEALLAARADLDLASHDRLTPAFIAAQLGHEGPLELLVRGRADANWETGSGATPLSVAVSRGKVEAVKVLVRARADVNRTHSRNGSGLAYLAVIKGYAAALEVLLGAGADPDLTLVGHRSLSPVVLAARKGLAEELSLLLEARGHADQVPGTSAYPLIDAVGEGHLEVVKCLIEHRATVNAISRGAGALSTASHMGFRSVCEALVSAGAQALLSPDGAEPPSLEASPVLTSLRPTRHSNSLHVWLTAGAPSLQVSSGRHYYELALGEDVHDPQVGWATAAFEALERSNGMGLGDEADSWAVDGERMLRWHGGRAGQATWPERWVPGGVVGCAIDVDAGCMRFSYNGQWLEDASFSFEPGGRAFFPAASLMGDFAFALAAPALRFSPPDGTFLPILDAGACGPARGAFKRPRPVFGSAVDAARRAGHGDLAEALGGGALDGS